MRNIQKVISLILVLAMMLSTFGIASFAASDLSITATSDKTTVQKDDTFTITVKVGASDQNILSMLVRLVYDPVKIEFVSAANGTLGDKFTSQKSVTNQSNSTMTYINGNYAVNDETIANTSESILYTATFKVLTDVAGDIAPTLSVEEVYDGDYNEISYVTTQAVVSVGAATIPVTGITVAPTTLTLTEGETGTLTVTVTPDNATDKTVTWTSSNDSVATVKDGVVTAVAAGTATITAKAGEKEATCAVTVNAAVVPVTGVTLDNETLELNKGESGTLTAVVAPENATNQTVTWTSSDTDVIAVENGTVTAVGKGTATITVTTEDGGFTDTCTVTVNVPVTGVTLSKTETALIVDGTETLTATVAPADASNTNVTWTSSNTAAATVENGVVTAVAEGEAVITVTTEDGGYTATCEVTVPHTVHTKDETEWKYDETSHWRACTGCELHLDEVNHSGGTATCKEQAKCEVCEQLYGELAAHNAVKTEAKDAGCTTAGNIAYWYCSVCDKCFSDEACTTEITLEETVIPAAHNVDKTVWKTNGDMHWHACTGTDDLLGACTYTEDQAAHTFEWVIDTPATEEEVGVKHEECTVCGYKRNENTPIDKLPHTHSMTYVSGTEATCSATGKKAHWVCSKADHPDCAGTFADEAGNTPMSEITIPVDPENHVNTTIINKKPATTEEEGYTGDTYCSDCKKTIVYGESVDKITHVCSPADEWSSDETYHWHECYDSDVCDEIMDKDTHTSSKWIVDSINPIRYKECKVCGYVLEIDKLENPIAEDFDWYYWYTAVQATRSYTVTASAGKGGEISPSGITTVKNGGSLTLEITPDEGYEVEMVKVDGVRRGAMDEYTFRNVASNHRIEVTFKKLPVEEKEPAVDVTEENVWENPFYDIFETDEYYDAVRFVYEMGLFKGESEHMFVPGKTMNRAMFVTVLGRLAGVDVSEYTGTSYEDVPAGEWYSEYVEWAAQNGIVEGYGNGKFGPMDLITVEQAAVIIGRYVRYAGITTEVFYENLADYADAELVSDWAADDMNWAVETGIYDGEGDLLTPQAEAPRSLVAEMLYELVLWLEN